MNHQQAIAAGAVEKYCLNEMAGQEREEFEAHFFDCLECAADIRATDAFLNATKTELGRPHVAPRPAPWWQSLLRPGVLGTVCASLLAALLVENTLLLPSSRTPTRDGPEVLPQLSLVGGDTRSADQVRVSLKGAHGIILAVDVPAEDRFSGYSCALQAPSGKTVWRLAIARQLADNTIWLRVPAGPEMAGQYTLLVQGLSAESQQPVNLAHYQVTIEP